MSVKHEPNVITFKVALPTRLYRHLERMKREGGHRSISGMVRSIITQVVEDDTAAHAEAVSRETEPEAR